MELEIEYRPDASTAARKARRDEAFSKIEFFFSNVNRDIKIFLFAKNMANKLTKSKIHWLVGLPEHEDFNDGMDQEDSVRFCAKVNKYLDNFLRQK